MWSEKWFAHIWKKIEGVAFFFLKYNLPQNQVNWVGLRVPMWDVWFNSFLRLFSKHAVQKPTVCAAIEPQVHICKLLNMQGDSDQTCRRTQLEACMWVFVFFAWQKWYYRHSQQCTLYRQWFQNSIVSAKCISFFELGVDFWLKYKEETFCVTCVFTRS